MVALTWQVSNYKVHKLHPLTVLGKKQQLTSGGVYVPCIYSHMPGESYHR